MNGYKYALAAALLTLFLSACAGNKPAIVTGTTAPIPTDTSLEDTAVPSKSSEEEGKDVEIKYVQSYCDHARVKVADGRLLFIKYYTVVGEIPYTFSSDNPTALMAVRGDTMVFCPTYSGKAFVTADGGKTWTKAVSSGIKFIYSVLPRIFSDEGISVIFYNKVGKSEAYISSDGGRSFQKTPSDIPYFSQWDFINSAVFYDADTAVVTYGYATRAADLPSVAVTTDGGKTWKVLEVRVPKALLTALDEKLTGKASDACVHADCSFKWNGCLYVRVKVICGIYPKTSTVFADVLYLKSADGGKTWTLIDNLE